MNPVIYGVFPELEQFIVNSNGNGDGNLNVAATNGGFVRAGVAVGRLAAIQTPSIGPRTEAWWHFATSIASVSTADSFFVTLVDTVNGREFARIDGNNGIYALETSASGTSFVRDGTQTFSGVGTGDPLLDIDIHVALDPTGNSLIEVFVNQLLTITFEGPLGVAAFSDAIILTSPQQFSLGPTEFYEVMVADSPLLGYRIATQEIEAQLTPSDFTGLVSDIAAFDSDISAVMTAQAGDEHAFQLGDLSAVAGTANPVAVFAQASAQGDAAVTSFDIGLRVAGTPVLQNNPVAAGFTAIGAAFDFNNPVTGVPWSITDIDALELFIRANA